MLTLRKTIALSSWPDPMTQERLEDMDFFFDSHFHTWIHFCNEDELPALHEWLKRHHLHHRVFDAAGRGELKRLPKLSDSLLIKTGGSPILCSLCGANDIPCRLWIEGDDTDSIDYPNPARFFLCGKCVQTQMQPHPRLYAPAPDQL